MSLHLFRFGLVLCLKNNGILLYYLILVLDPMNNSIQNYIWIMDVVSLISNIYIISNLEKGLFQTNLKWYVAVWHESMYFWSLIMSTHWSSTWVKTGWGSVLKIMKLAWKLVSKDGYCQKPNFPGLLNLYILSRRHL